MSGAVQITLDTTPPVFEWDRIPPIRPAWNLSVPYHVNEPSQITAIIKDSEGQEFDMAVGNDTIDINLNRYFAPGHAEVRISAVDEVGNETVMDMPIQVWNDRFPLLVIVEPDEQFVAVDEDFDLILLGRDNDEQGLP